MVYRRIAVVVFSGFPLDYIEYMTDGDGSVCVYMCVFLLLR